MMTFVNSKWKFVGVVNGNLCFMSKIFGEERILCGASCKFVDVATGNVIFLNLCSGKQGVEAEWSYSTLRKATAKGITLPDAASLLVEV